MSESGLYSGLYQNLHECADLVDKVLINLKTGKNLKNDSFQQMLAVLLLELAEDQSDNLPARLIQLLLHNQNNVTRADLVRVGNALKTGAVLEETIYQLETIAQALEAEQGRAMARIQQWTG
jgi:hypothetical protein